jgi:hypothetical protein
MAETPEDISFELGEHDGKRVIWLAFLSLFEIFPKDMVTHDWLVIGS